MQTVCMACRGTPIVQREYCACCMMLGMHPCHFKVVSCSSTQLTYTELGLQKGWQKRGIMWKTGEGLTTPTSQCINKDGYIAECMDGGI